MREILEVVVINKRIAEFDVECFNNRMEQIQQTYRICQVIKIDVTPQTSKILLLLVERI